MRQIPPIPLYKQWRSEAEKWISEFSALQKEAEKNKDFDLAKHWGQAKRDSLYDLKRINGYIDWEERLRG